MERVGMMKLVPGRLLLEIKILKSKFIMTYYLYKDVPLDLFVSSQTIKDGEVVVIPIKKITICNNNIIYLSKSATLFFEECLASRALYQEMEEDIDPIE